MTRNPFPAARRLAVSLSFLLASAILSACLTAASAQVPCPQPLSPGPIVVRNNHIFCGDVSDGGVAGGFHSRPGGVNPATITILPITTTTIPAGPPPAPAGIYRLNNFNITDPITGVTGLKAFSTMFPDACTMPNVVAAIQHAAANAVLVAGNWVGPSGPACQAGMPPAPFDIRIIWGAGGPASNFVRTAHPNY
jgi:hypothetical protein